VSIWHCIVGRAVCLGYIKINIIIIKLPARRIDGDGSRSIGVRRDDCSDLDRLRRADPDGFDLVPRVLLVVDRHAADVGVVQTTIDVVQRQTYPSHSVLLVACCKFFYYASCIYELYRFYRHVSCCLCPVCRWCLNKNKPTLTLSLTYRSLHQIVVIRPIIVGAKKSSHILNK